jgi:small-conductance mechanosensitive channel
VISLKVDRKDNPEFIKTIIFDVLLKHPEVVSIPEPEVYMTQMSENTLDFEVRYFINLQMGSSRVKVRSEILFLLWETFKHHNIVLPSPQQDVHVHTLFQQGGVS